MAFPSPDKLYTVVIVVKTFNHELYIEQTLEGIIHQECTFPFVALVIDDFSNDRTVEIIQGYEKKYPHIIKSQYNTENQYSKGNHILYDAIPWLSYTKYVAICEGDDYWIDPLKLQKQVHLMNNNPDCTLCFHRVIEDWQEGCENRKVLYPVENRRYNSGEIFKNWIVSTASVLIRAEIFKHEEIFSIYNNKNLLYYDQPLYVYCSIKGAIIGMSDVMGVYRRVTTGETLKLHSNLDKLPYVKRFCSHNREMKKLFGTSCGQEFCDFADYQIVRYSLMGAYHSIYNKKLKEGFSLLEDSFQCSIKKTISIGLFLLVRNFFERVGVDPTCIGNYIRSLKSKK